MTLSVNVIEGRRGSICNNDAFSIVAGDQKVVDIIPASDVPGKNANDVLAAFQEAAATVSDRQLIKPVARRALGLG